MRCLALAQALREQGHDVEVAACELPDALAERLEKEQIKLERIGAARGSDADWKAIADMVQRDEKHCVVLDGYVFSKVFQESLRRYCCLSVVDDCAYADGYSADLLVNPNLFAKEEMYEGQDIKRMLIGHSYAILRREFWEQADRPASLKTRRILITMGGSDPDNVTGKMIRSVKKLSLDHVEIRAVSGASNPYWETLQVQAGRDGHPVELLRDVQNMREQYEWCDVAIAAAGNTALELACVGVPSLFVILVDNQELLPRAIRKYGFGRVLGWHEDLNEETIRKEVRDLLVSTEDRDRMAQWGRKVIDGKGALRVAAAIAELG